MPRHTGRINNDVLVGLVTPLTPTQTDLFLLHLPDDRANVPRSGGSACSRKPFGETSQSSSTDGMTLDYQAWICRGDMTEKAVF